MTAAADRRIVVLARASSLNRMSSTLRARGWEVVRVATIAAVPVPIRRVPPWLRRRPVADIWAVTSRAVADTVLRAHPEWERPLRTIPVVVAVGPGTARALRARGFVALRVADEGGARELLRHFGHVRGRRILYLRSNRAGPHLARRLRHRGARVVERVVYRVRESGPVGARQRARLRSVPVWAVASPTALAGFRRMLGRPEFDRQIARVRLFALGERTARAARAAGARRVVTPSRSTEEGFTNLLEQALDDGSESADGRR